MQTDMVCPPDTEDYVMPCAEAMLAGTLALMTGYAQSAQAQHAGLMARKIVSNLFFLSRHPALSPEFRRVVERLHGAWGGVAKTPPDKARAPSRHAVPMPACATVQ